jgi:hypothetical protein
MVASLAMPSSGASSCSIAHISPPDMSCCGTACPCPTGKVCDELLSVALDRVTGHAQQDVFRPAAQFLYSLALERGAFPAKPIKLSSGYARPPPFSVSSPPQAQLRIWII